MSIWLRISYLQAVKEGRHAQLYRVTELAWNLELVIQIAVQIQDKIKLVIQGTWSQSKITLISKIDRIKLGVGKHKNIKTWKHVFILPL